MAGREQLGHYTDQAGLCSARPAARAWLGRAGLRTGGRPLVQLFPKKKIYFLQMAEAHKHVFSPALYGLPLLDPHPHNKTRPNRKFQTC